MDGPDLVLWQDEQLLYPLSGDTILGFQMATYGGAVVIFGRL
jgi:hypothetical protein